MVDYECTWLLEPHADSVFPKILFQLGKRPNVFNDKTKITLEISFNLQKIKEMKFAYLFAIAVRAQDGGDGGTPHDPEAMAYCQGKLKRYKNSLKNSIMN